MFASMGGEAGTARQLAGLLRGGGGDLAAQRVARLVAEACTGVEPAEASRQCAALRDSILQLCSDGTLTLPEARLLCRKIDGAQAAMLEALSSPQRALDALERALSDTPVRGLPELVVQGSLSADSAALLIGENRQLVIRATAGLELPPDAADPASVAGRALLESSVVEASDTENARAVLAFPLQFGDELLGVLRVSSRTAWKFSEDERRFLRAIATRAAALLAGDDPQARLRHTLRTFESLIEASPLPILSIDRNGSVQIWNHAAEELFGWQRHEVVGKSIPLGAQDLEEALRIRQEIDGGRVIRNQEVRWKRKDGTHLDLALSAAPLRDPAGAVSGSIAILVDITDRKQREEQAERTSRFRERAE